MEALIHEHPLLVFFGIMALFIALMIFASWPHKIGYVLFIIFFLGEMDKLGEIINTFVVKHPFWEFIYSDWFAWLLLIYCGIGIIETIIRLLFPGFMFEVFIAEYIIDKIKVYRILHDPAYGQKVMGDDYIPMEERGGKWAKKAAKMKKKEHKKKVASYNHNSNLNQLRQELNDMVGLTGVKKEIEDIISVEEFKLKREKSGLKGREIGAAGHLVFAGNPGTGKTTVARKLAEIYKELGVVSRGQLVEVDRASLVGQYMGETAIKTKEKIREALGGVLFIDEAYTLAGDSPRDYGYEAINTLLKEMEDHKGEFLVIVAGYPERMRNFINSNPGLSSRFKRTIVFEDYNPDELLDIFKQECEEDNNILTPEAEAKVHNQFKVLYNNRGENFGNGRAAKGLYLSVIQKMSSRVGRISKPTKEQLQTILPEDI